MEKIEFVGYSEEIFSQPQKTTPIAIKNLIKRTTDKRIITIDGARTLLEECF